MGTRVGTGAVPVSRCTRQPDSAVTEPAASANNSDLRDQEAGIRLFVGMVLMMA
jgi:hypothetical protein